MRYVVSTYDPQDQIIRDGFYEGPKVVSFYILQHDMSRCLKSLINIESGAKEMGRPVEIEFAVDIKIRSLPHFMSCKLDLLLT